MKINLIFLIILVIETRTYIIIPFKIRKYPINNNETLEKNFLQNFLFNIFSAKIEVGTPPQIIETQISGQKFGIQLKEGICFSSQYYNKKYSSSLIEKSHCESTNIYNLYKEISVNETISFNTYEKNKLLKVKNLSMLYLKEFSEQEKNIVKKYGRKIELFDDFLDFFNPKNNSLEINKDGKACLLIGMQLTSSYNCLPNSNFISLLKDNNIIKDSNWAIKYYNENENKNESDGEFIIGAFPHEYFQNAHNENQLMLSNVLNYKYYQDWELQFKSVYFFKQNSENNVATNNIDINNNENIILVNNNVNIEFDIDIKLILGTKKYFTNINEYYFKKNQNKCDYKILDNKYGIFICSKNLMVNDFPTLYFYNHIYNYTFEMNHTNLFLDIDDKKYFLIVFDETKPDIWTFGTLFLKQYSFVFNTNEKTIGFYNNEIKKEKIDIKIWTYLLYAFFILITGIGGFFLGKKVYNKVRGKKIYELNDGFIYKSSEEPKIAMEMSSK